jgi:DtxR family Mn-dependent transcriptional regulator
MLPSSTVENYLKAIFLGTAAPREGEAQSLLPMGQLSSALGVAPGTATAMVKTLSESGLVRYEPYAGVALTPAGERLAALVVRRHRLLELFLVQVLGFGWDEVHDEAEHLEHAVSDRLIDRIDEMLGRPEVDPHGDPIPDAAGALRREPMQTLLTCRSTPLSRSGGLSIRTRPSCASSNATTSSRARPSSSKHAIRQRTACVCAATAPTRSPSAPAPPPRCW